MMAIAVLTGMLTTQVKTHEAIKAESEKERMRANLLRAVSHDIRTPLTTIYGASTTLLESGDNLYKRAADKDPEGDPGGFRLAGAHGGKSSVHYAH